MILCLDSSVWIELFTNGEHANIYADAFANADSIIVPTIVIYEVRRYSLARFARDDSNGYWALMTMKKTVDLDANLASYAARLANEKKLTMADAIIYATTLEHDAELWTQDAHFTNLPSVKYFAK